MSEPAEITLRAYRDGEEGDIARLLQANYPNTPSVEAIRTMWMWQFRNDVSRNSCVAVAEMNGRLVGHYAVMWLPMRYLGRTIQGAISTATVTDKSVRGRGVFVNLARKAYENLAADGCSLVFGFPNSQSIHGFVSKLNWLEPAPFPVHVRPLRARPFLERKLGTGFLAIAAGAATDALLNAWSAVRAPSRGTKTLSFAQVQAIPQQAAELWLGTFGAAGIALLRDKRYLDWRYLQKPGFSYHFVVASEGDQPVGYAVYCIEQKLGLRMMYLMEFVSRNDDAVVAAALCRHLEDLALQQQADAISMLILPGDPNQAVFGRMGFIHVPRKLFPQDIYFGAMPNGPEVTVETLRSDRNWYISWGDLDVV